MDLELSDLLDVARTSATKASGFSMAAKWPPLGGSL